MIWRASASSFRDSRHAFAGWGYGERAQFGLAINDLVKKGKIKAPIVIGRDHLDCGSVASPFRETESMKDGSDAVADWPLLNALLNTAAGASWVSIHNGGGVGIGYSLHAGQVTVADGTEMMAKRIERVLTTDPGMGVIRHVDAGYDEAKKFAKKTGIKCHGPVGRFVGVARRLSRLLNYLLLESKPKVRLQTPPTGTVPYQYWPTADTAIRFRQARSAPRFRLERTRHHQECSRALPRRKDCFRWPH